MRSPGIVGMRVARAATRHIIKGEPMTRGKTRSRRKTAQTAHAGETPDTRVRTDDDPAPKRGTSRREPVQGREPVEAVGANGPHGAGRSTEDGLDDERATGQVAGLTEDVLDLRQEMLEDTARGTGRKEGPARDPTGNETENGPQVDPADPNLSAVMAEAGAQEDQASLGMGDDAEDDRMRLEDPEKLS